MKLLHVPSMKIEVFYEPVSVPYAILSHTWGGDPKNEVTFQDMEDIAIASKKPGFDKVKMSCIATRKHQLRYLWIDTICIDKTSSAELSESINSMREYYLSATVCFVWLADLSSTAPHLDRSSWGKCRYWTRAWTLMELILPAKMEFYDSDWNQIGSKDSRPLLDLIANITNIEARVLKDRNALPSIPAARKLAWAAGRKASRVEDESYALLGLFNVKMPIIFGEGRRAFQRLLEEVAKATNDPSIFAWRSATCGQYSGIFPREPADFLECLQFPISRMALPSKQFIHWTNAGILLTAEFAISGRYLCMEVGKKGRNGPGKRCGIILEEHSGIFLRKQPESIIQLSGAEKRITTTILISRGNESDLCELGVSRLNSRSGAKKLARDAAAWNTQLYNWMNSLNHDAEGTQNENRLLPATFQAADKWEPCAHARVPSASELNRRKLSRRSESSGSTEILSASASSFPTTSRTLSLEDPQSRVSTPQLASKSKNQGKEKNLRYHAHYRGCSSVSLDSSELDRTSTSGDSLLSLGAISEAGQFELPLEKPFLSLKSEIASSALVVFQNRKISSFLKVSNQDSSMPKSRKRLRRATGDNQNGPLWISATTGVKEQRELACPYYKKDTVKYRSCLTGFCLSSTAAVVAHICHHHRLPYHCPLCYEVFERAGTRDLHLQQRSCELGPPTLFSGVSEEQQDRLACMRHKRHDEVERWYKIWEVVFPESPFPKSPYLSHGRDLNVSQFRHFWQWNGESFVSDFLRSRGMLSWELPNEERNLKALYAAVLAEGVGILAGTA